MDGAVAPCELVPMDGRRSRLPDEVHGACAAGSLLAGDLELAEAELARVRAGYLVRFLCRLAVVSPGISLRLAWRVAA